MKRKDQDGVDAAQTTGVKAIEAVTPVGKEKALEAIQTLIRCWTAEYKRKHFAYCRVFFSMRTGGAQLG